MKLFFILILTTFSFAQAAIITLSQNDEKELREKIQRWWEKDVHFLENLKQGEVIAWGAAQGEKNRQKLQTKVVGLHPRTCAKGLRKISRYEDYHQHMSFVAESRYQEENQLVRLTLDHAVLPFPMILSFKLPRITTPGVTPFVFLNGIFAGLKGEIHVASVGNRCAYFMQASWEGPATGLPDIVVSTIAQTLTKIGLEHLIRISRL